jgi:MFS transporter, OFA family, oxalate/formate antiporter
MRRYLILVSAIAMQLCLGATYSWSVFVKPLRELTGLSQAVVQTPFTVFYFAFPVTVIFSGFALKRLGPARSAAAGGLLFGLGWMFASLGSHHFAMTVIGIGLLAGTGVGLAYVVPLAVLVQWFPHQKGLVTGIAVAGFGGGAALISQIAGRLVSAQGLSPYAVFGLMGCVFVVIATTAGFVMKFPPGGAQQAVALLPYTDILRRKEFRLLYAVMIVALAAGFSVNANLKELFPAGGIAVGILGVSVFAAANAVGRIAWGALFDRMPEGAAVRANLIAQSCVFLASPWLLMSQTGFLLLAIAAGFNYGGVLVLYASTVTHVWGAERVGQVYGMLFSANIVAAPAPVLAGLWYDATKNFWWFLVALAIVLLFCAFSVPTPASPSPPGRVPQTRPGK